MSTAILPWHTDVLTSLRDTHAQDRLPHALGLTAPSGWGVALLAEQLARALLALPQTQPIDEIAHPDLRWVVPDGATLKIKEIRDVRDYAVQTPQIAKLKVIVLVQAELLNREAANALLKTLEEPPPNTLLVLCSENWGRLLPTVRSRCQQINVPCSQQLALAWLQEQGITISAQAFADAGYAPLTALKQAELDINGWLDEVAAKGPDADVMASMPEDLAGWLAAWYRAILRRSSELLSADQAAAAEPEGAPARLQAAAQLIDFTRELLSVRRQLMTHNIRTGPLLVERLAFLWHRLHREMTV